MYFCVINNTVLKYDFSIAIGDNKTVDENKYAYLGKGRYYMSFKEAYFYKKK